MNTHRLLALLCVLHSLPLLAEARTHSKKKEANAPLQRPKKEKVGATPRGAETWLRVALLFAHNDAGGRARKLTYAISDARKMRDVLLQVAGYKASNVFLATNQNATQLQRVFSRVTTHIRKLRQGKPNTKLTLLVYYSGHARNGTFYLGRSSLSFQVLRRFLRTSGASLRLAFLDTCGSGRFLRLRGLRRHKQGLRIPVLHTQSARGEAIITSTGDRENAYEDLKLRGGIFTHYMVTGLRGAADRNRDGRVTLNELYAYTYHRTLNRTVFAQAGPQKPHFHTNLRGTGQVVLSTTRRTNTSLRFHPALAGHFFIWDAKKHLYAGFHKTPGSALRLAMLPGPYKIQWRHKQQVFTTRVRLRAHQVFHLGLKHRKLAYTRGQQARGTDTIGASPPSAALWKPLPAQHTPSPWSLQLLGGLRGAAFTGSALMGGGAIGLRHPFFSLRIGAWGTSVSFQKTTRQQLHLTLRAEGGYRHAWGKLHLFAGLYAGLGVLIQDVNIDPLPGTILHAGATLAPGLWLNERWGLALQSDIGLDLGNFGLRWRAFFHWSTMLALRYRF